MTFILFDIDSTLLKDGGASADAFVLAFSSLFAVEAARVDMQGKTDSVIADDIALGTLGRPLTQSELALLYARYSIVLRETIHNNQHFELLAGAAELCAHLSGNDRYCLGIQTGNIETCAHEKLARGNLQQFFKFGGYGSDAKHREGIIEMALDRGRQFLGAKAENRKAIVIGDSTYDMSATVRNGAMAIGVTTGKHTKQELYDAGAAGVVENLSFASGINELIENS
jgi:phosphoglycolate phosphatase-like HAD superfamily hydrolase